MDTTHLQSNGSTLPSAVRIIKSREELLKALPGYMTHPDCRRWLLHIDKVPHYANGYKRYGTLDSPEDRGQLVNFDNAYAIFSAGGYTGLGFALGFDGESGHWQGIDLDDIWHKPELNTLKLPGYVESSPSGNGLHAIGYGQAFRTLGAIGTGIEAYSHGRYFTITGNGFNELLGLEIPIQPVCLANYVEQVLRPIHGSTEAQGTILAGYALKAMVTLSSEQMEDLRSALFSMPADDRDLWIAMGQALRWVVGGKELWAEWSETSSKYQEDSDLDRWDGFPGDRTSYKSVFKRAEDNGWENPRKRPDPALIFAKQQESTLAPVVDLGWSKISIADIFTNPSKPPLFPIEQLLPAGLLTILSAHGGTGKSMLALQAAVCLAIGIPFMGKSVIKSRVIFYSAEDSTEIIRYRLGKICKYLDLNPQNLADHMLLLDSTATPCLYRESGGGVCMVTQGYSELQTHIKSFDADVIIIDNASDTFEANENSRSHVRGFVRSLVQMGKQNNSAILLLAHIDKNTARGDSHSEGYSGSTAWHNSARSRLYLIAKDGVLQLHHQKSNHGKLSEPIFMTSSPPDYVLTHKASEFVIAQEQDVTREVLALLAEYYDKGIYVSDSPSAQDRHPFIVMGGDASFPKYITTKKQMNTLLIKARFDGYLVSEGYRDCHRKKQNRYRVIVQP